MTSLSRAARARLRALKHSENLSCGHIKSVLTPISFILPGMLNYNGRDMCQVGRTTPRGKCSGATGPGTKYGMVCEASAAPPPSPPAVGGGGDAMAMLLAQKNAACQRLASQDACGTNTDCKWLVLTQSSQTCSLSNTVAAQLMGGGGAGGSTSAPPLPGSVTTDCAACIATFSSIGGCKALDNLESSLQRLPCSPEKCGEAARAFCKGTSSGGGGGDAMATLLGQKQMACQKLASQGACGTSTDCEWQAGMAGGRQECGLSAMARMQAMGLGGGGADGDPCKGAAAFLDVQEACPRLTKDETCTANNMCKWEPTGSCAAEMGSAAGMALMASADGTAFAMRTMQTAGDADKACQAAGTKEACASAGANCEYAIEFDNIDLASASTSPNLVCRLSSAKRIELPGFDVCGSDVGNRLVSVAKAQLESRRAALGCGGRRRRQDAAQRQLDMLRSQLDTVKQNRDMTCRMQASIFYPPPSSSSLSPSLSLSLSLSFYSLSLPPKLWRTFIFTARCRVLEGPGQDTGPSITIR